VGLIDLHPGAGLKSKVEGRTVKHRYVARRHREAAETGHERLHAPVWERTELIAEWAKAAHVRRPCSAQIGCGAGIYLVLRYQDDVQRSAGYRAVYRYGRSKQYGP